MKLLQEGRLVLLLDAMNEMPRRGGQDYEEKVQSWGWFLSDLLRQAPGNPVIFSCRSLDYSAPLVLEAGGRVPHVRIERLSDEDIQGFLKAYCAEHADAIWRYIDAHKQKELYDLPYYLWLLTRSVAGNAGQPPDNRAELFSGFVRDALRRDIDETKNPLLTSSAELLNKRDRKRLSRMRGCALPEGGRLITGLADLAYGMQDRHRGGSGNTQVVIAYEEALALLNRDDEQADNLLEAGVAIQVLEDFSAIPEDKGSGSDEEQVQFVHQLMQEYFAARRLARSPNPRCVETPWRAVEATLEPLKPGDPLPSPTTTGWEETTLLAGIMTQDQDAYVGGLMEANLPLAGRCAAQGAWPSALGLASVYRPPCWSAPETPRPARRWGNSGTRHLKGVVGAPAAICCRRPWFRSRAGNTRLAPMTVITTMKDHRWPLRWRLFSSAATR